MFRDKLPFFVEGVYVVLFVWHQEEGVSKWFKEGHCFIYPWYPWILGVTVSEKINGRGR